MGEERSGKSHAMAWTLSVLGLPLLYLLSVAPLSLLTMRSHPRALQPDWLMKYKAPENWIRDNTFLEAPLAAYETWWRHDGP
jgi:hypothetical protein